MAVTKNDIRQWFLEGKAGGATHMIIVWNQYDERCFPVYVMPDGDILRSFVEEQAKRFQTIMEVYCLGRDMEEQLNEKRAFNSR